MERNASPRKRRCPFTRDPSEECYVTRLRSQDVSNAISYCGGEFEECEIYQKRLCGAKDESANEDEDRLSCGSQHAGKP